MSTKSEPLPTEDTILLPLDPFFTAGGDDMNQNGKRSRLETDLAQHATDLALDVHVPPPIPSIPVVTDAAVPAMDTIDCLTSYIPTLQQQQLQQQQQLDDTAGHLESYAAAMIDHPQDEGLVEGQQPPRKKPKGPQTALHREWIDWYNDLLEYGATFGHCNVPSTFEFSPTRKIGWWLTNQRRSKKHGKLRPDREAMLQTLVDSNKLRWNVEKPPPGEFGHTGWEAWFDDLLRYDADNGHCNVPVVYETASGRKLGQWLNNQKRLKRANRLQPDRQALLQTLVSENRLVW